MLAASHGMQPWKERVVGVVITVRYDESDQGVADAVDEDVEGFTGYEVGVPRVVGMGINVCSPCLEEEASAEHHLCTMDVGK